MRLIRVREKGESRGAFVERDKPFAISRNERDPILLQNRRDPAGSAIGRSPERKNGLRACNLSPITHAIVKELTHSIAHSIDGLTGIGEAFRFNKQRLVAAADEEIDVVVVPTMAAQAFSVTSNQLEGSIVILARTLL